MRPKFFSSPAEFREWLEENHNVTTELLLGFHKQASGKKSITYAEALDEALCFGWIDGVRKSLGRNGSYLVFREMAQDVPTFWRYLQDRSRENDIDIVFVHPIEFLVTNGRGKIVDRHFIGEELFLSSEELSGPKDQHSVIIYDLPISQR